MVEPRILEIADHLLLHGYRVRVAADAVAMDVLLTPRLCLR